MTPTQDTSAFAQYFIEETSALEIELPNGEPMLHNGVQVIVKLHGPSTPVWVAAIEAKEKEATKRVFAAMGQKGKNARKDADADAHFLCAVTASFENFPYPGGMEAIYREPRLKYINSQVNAHLNDMGNFYKTGEKS